MSKSTAAVILPSVARLAPWGEPGWRFGGAMQLVTDGPDWLAADWPTLGGDDSVNRTRSYGSMTLREDPFERAEDIVVMSFALMGVSEWPSLQPWWDDEESRLNLRPHLAQISERYDGEFKLAIVNVNDRGLTPSAIEQIRSLGWDATLFTPDLPA